MISSPSGPTFSEGRRYGVIYADPPWHFRNWSSKGTGRNAISHYDCLDFPALAGLPVAQLAAPNCVLFLWATDPLLPRALDLIRAWGFEYKDSGFLLGEAQCSAQARCRLLHRYGLLDPRQSRAMPPGDTRQASTLGQGRAPSRSGAAPRAQPETRLRSRADRTACRRSVPRTVRPRDKAGLGLLGQSTRTLRPRSRTDATAAISSRRRSTSSDLRPQAWTGAPRILDEQSKVHDNAQTPLSAFPASPQRGLDRRL